MAGLRRLDLDQLARFALTALDNARRLHQSALLLGEHDYRAPAFILAGLAADEVGKHILVTSFPARPQTDEEWRKFWTRLARHQEKLGNTVMSSWIADLESPELPPDPSALRHQRLAATYVDVDDSGNVRELVVDQADLQALLSQVADEIAYCEQANGNLTAEELARRMEAIRESPLLAAYDEPARVDPLGGIALVIAIRAGLPLEAARAAAVEIAAQGDRTFSEES